jgi:hypothetical protein
MSENINIHRKDQSAEAIAAPLVSALSVSKEIDVLINHIPDDRLLTVLQSDIKNFEISDEFLKYLENNQILELITEQKATSIRLTIYIPAIFSSRDLYGLSTCLNSVGIDCKVAITPSPDSNKLVIAFNDSNLLEYTDEA